MDKCREEFQKAFPIPAHWVEFDEKTNRYYCPYVADATASKYQSQWVVWQHLYEKMGELETAIDSLSDENAHFRNKKWDQNEDFTKLQAKVDEQAQEISNLKSLIQGHELRHQQNLSIKQKLTRRSEELQKRVDAALELMQKPVIVGEPSNYVCVRFKELEQALKGEG
ncbi:hypothetical protein [Acinetobacter baumannii]|uniref:hypothetical protein n=1 Tax=Acinetobacter baumannii TaxID=470 RepID=UPI001900C585|nr:hypothetical protein [Acinetobacter baumannii]MBJ9388256.1 hypothetical protein [Acinetobacter baumannii]MBJ9432314.1 hypothetical protein [Acinetobacter baumannii]